MSLVSGSKSVSSSPMEKLWPVGSSSVEGSELSQRYLHKDQMTKVGLEHNLVGTGNGTSPLMNSWRANDKDFGFRANLSIRSAALFTEGNKVDMSGFHYDNGLFSSSLSELLDRKCV